MPYRYTFIRIVDPSAGLDRTEYRPFNLLWAALAASEETMQGSLMASAWLELFQSHLSAHGTNILRWQGDLAESAEMRRAYSAMYGRYFSRGLLASRRGFTDFASLENGCAVLKGGVTVKRSKKGDTPDWIAWDPAAGSYVLAEAKGRLTGDEDDFLYSVPSCIKNGKASLAGSELPTRMGERSEPEIGWPRICGRRTTGKEFQCLCCGIPTEWAKSFCLRRCQRTLQQLAAIELPRLQRGWDARSRCV